ncbi:MAG: WD40 repeat domain-containing protein, partial [Planctomycetota bacterium]
VADAFLQRQDNSHPEERLTAAAYSTDATSSRPLAASVDDKGRLRVWELDKYPLGQQPPVTAEPLLAREHQRRALHAVAFVQGTRVVVACDDGALHLHDAKHTDREAVSVQLPHGDVPLSLGVSPDGRELVVGTARGLVLRYAVK